MITKEQALTCKNFVQVARYSYSTDKYEDIIDINTVNDRVLLDKAKNWRAYGQCKTWKRSPGRFELPIKHGLYDYGYITEENAHLFEVAYESIGAIDETR